MEQQQETMDQTEPPDMEQEPAAQAALEIMEVQVIQEMLPSKEPQDLVPQQETLELPELLVVET
jgi:hypothetical protein